ncbi:hypothetical protein Tco_0812404 [Tanacetum coccineum]
MPIPVWPTVPVGNRSDGYASIVASEQRAELFNGIGTLERDNMRLRGMLGVDSRELIVFGVVSPRKGVMHFGKRGKLNHRYIGPFKILAKVGTVAYQLKLPEQLSRVHSTFRVSNLKKYLSDETQVIPLDKIQIDDTFYFIEEPFEIIDREVKRLNKSHIPIVKARWNSRRGPEFTWECED